MVGTSGLDLFASIVLIFALCVDANAQPSWETGTEPRRFVPTEAIVKFHNSTEGHAIVKAATEAEPKSDPLLRSLVRELGRQVAIPLVVTGVTSGEELLVRIDSELLIEDVARRLRSIGVVTNVDAISSEASLGTTSLRLQFTEGSHEEKIVHDRRYEASRYEISALVSELSEFSGVPLQYQVDGERRLVVEMNVYELTEILVRRLSALSGVEYAELNQIMGFMGVQ